MTGAELAAIRKRTGMSQTVLAQLAHVGRHAVSYWECKAQVDRQAWAVKRMARILRLPDSPEVSGARAWQAVRQQAICEAEEQAFAAMRARMLAREEAARLSRRVRCGARTRKGTPCRMKSEPGKQRCKFHGGMSTGARTPEGKARIAEAQRRRWERWRLEKQGRDLAAAVTDDAGAGVEG